MKENNTPTAIAKVLIFLISYFTRQRENTELVEDDLGDCMCVTKVFFSLLSGPIFKRDIVAKSFLARYSCQTFFSAI